MDWYNRTHEAHYDFAGPTYRLELVAHWAGGTLFKLHPSQTRGRYDGVHIRDESPLEPSGTAIEPRPLSCPEEPSPRERERYNVTRLPYMGWCPACVPANAEEPPPNQQNDRMPATQLDCTFASTNGVSG